MGAGSERKPLLGLPLASAQSSATGRLAGGSGLLLALSFLPWSTVRCFNCPKSRSRYLKTVSAFTPNFRLQAGQEVVSRKF